MNNRTEVVVVQMFPKPLRAADLKRNKSNRREQNVAWQSLRRFLSDIKVVFTYLILDGAVSVEWQRECVVISRKIGLKFT